MSRPEATSAEKSPENMAKPFFPGSKKDMESHGDSFFINPGSMPHRKEEKTSFISAPLVWRGEGGAQEAVYSRDGPYHLGDSRAYGEQKFEAKKTSVSSEKQTPFESPMNRYSERYPEEILKEYPIQQESLHKALKEGVQVPHLESRETSLSHTVHRVSKLSLDKNILDAPETRMIPPSDPPPPSSSPAMRTSMEQKEAIESQHTTLYVMCDTEKVSNCYKLRMRGSLSEMPLLFLKAYIERITGTMVEGMAHYPTGKVIEEDMTGSKANLCPNAVIQVRLKEIPSLGNHESLAREGSSLHKGKGNEKKEILFDEATDVGSQVIYEPTPQEKLALTI